MTSLISPNDTWTLWALIVSGTALAIWLEQNYKWAARLSGPVLALLVAMVLSNTRLVPAQSPAYDFVDDYLVPLAIPLLLFRANALQIIRSTGRMFLAFHLASVGTLIGTFLAVFLLKGHIPSPDLEHAAGMMSASYIGGAVNFMAVKSSYNVRPGVSDPLIVADNFVMAAIFIVLLSAAASAFFRRRYPHPHSTDANSAEAENLAAKHWQRKGISLLDLGKALAVAFVAVALAKLVERAVKPAFGDVSHASLALQMLLVVCTNKFVLITGFSLLLATVFHKPMSAINGPEELGTFMLYLFLFCIGLPADLKMVFVQAPLFFVFCGIIAVVNLGWTLAMGKLLRFNLEELLLAVNANLGGAPSAAAMAVSAGWPRLVLPGILVGIWGYVLGTPIGVIVVEWLRR
ncbi:MAG: DUF819 family protein [Verrucomicrobia bacterium]|nr:DUF819 family protein [Verrucomicrobiota bacterium]